MTLSDPGTPIRAPRPSGWYLPWFFLGLTVVYLLSVFGRMNPPKEPYNLDGFARIPVVDGGRVKPLETVAQIYLRTISHRSTFIDEQGDKHPAILWYLHVLAASPSDPNSPGWNHKVIRIENDQVLAEMKLTPREGLRYSMNELEPRKDELERRAFHAMMKKRKGDKLDLFETKILELYNRTELVRHINNFGGNDSAENRLMLLPPQHENGQWKSLNQFIQESRREVILSLNLSLEEIRGLPREQQEELVANAEREIQQRIAANPPAKAWEDMVAAYRDKRPADFNNLVAEYQANFLGQVSAEDKARNRVEVMYDRFAPFYQCTGLYVLVFLLTGAGFIMRAAEKPQWGEALRKSATYVLVATLIVHATALVTRMYLMDRWFVFVTNLYSSAIFIGLGCVILGLILERLYPIGIGNMLAATLGLATTIVAHNIASEDTLEMMQAVLDTNFWLSTHVTTVTLGYTATFVAGFLGVIYIALMLAAVIRDSFTQPQPPTVAPLVAFGVAAAGLVTIPLLIAWPLITALAKFEVIHSSLPSILLFMLAAAAGIYAVALLVQRASVDGTGSSHEVPGIAKPIAAMALTPETGKILGQMIYGVVCFATLLSFVGTVLGGIWADQSWGRFWGWDPKENGAVLIVIWNALILHARWCGLVKDRGVAVLAVIGNIITAWSWFGTNQLGIGLHAYGFDTRLADGCANFWISMLMIMGLGLIPRQYWASATRRPSASGSGSTSAPSENGTPHVNGQAAGKGKKALKRR